MCRDLRAFLGVKFGLEDLLRVKDLTFRNSDQCNFASYYATALRTHFKIHSGEGQTNATNVFVHRLGQAI